MTHVLIISHDVVNTHMAGPGIRYWELARVLAAECTVTLAVPGQSELLGESFCLQTYQPGDWASMQPLAERADVILPCGFVIHQFPQLAQIGCPIVMDLYDPYPAETLALMSGRAREEQAAYHRSLVDQLRMECQSGDFYLCASERQRYWWLGMLAAHGRLNTATFQSDRTLRTLIDVVPFGCRPEPLQPTRQALKGVLPRVAEDDRVLLWGGGIWEWLDPLTLLAALRQVVDRRPNVKLLFPGTHHPNRIVPDMAMQRRAVEMAQELGLLDESVFFGSWVSWADWPNYLLEADIGVSLHQDTLEAQLAFRSRVLDYVRAGLPMLVSRGDVTSEIVDTYGLGIVVDCQDVAGVAEAIVALLDEPRQARLEQFAAARADFSWERVAQPLIAFCRAPYRAADRADALVSLSLPAPSVSEAQIACLEAERERQQTEIAQMRTLVEGYEQGRFIRLMRWMWQWRERLGF